jgi:hypothetical protein
MTYLQVYVASAAMTAAGLALRWRAEQPSGRHLLSKVLVLAGLVTLVNAAAFHAKNHLPALASATTSLPLPLSPVQAVAVCFLIAALLIAYLTYLARRTRGTTECGPPAISLELSRQRREAIRKRAGENFRRLRPSRWYHALVGCGFLLTPVVQYAGFTWTADSRWYFYPLISLALAWATIKLAAVTIVPARFPISWTSVLTFSAGTIVLALLISTPDSGLVLAWRAVVFDALVLGAMVQAIQSINFIRFRQGVR